MIIAEIKTNSEAINRSLGKIAKDLGNMSIPLKQSGMIMIRSIDMNFKQQGRPEKWKALKPSTIKHRKKGSSIILQNNGTLKNSFFTEIRGGTAIAIGTTNEYAAAHNFGITTTRNTAWGKPTKSYEHVLPERKFMLFQEKDKEEIDKVFSDFMGKVLTEKMVRIG